MHDGWVHKSSVLMGYHRSSMQMRQQRVEETPVYKRTPLCALLFHQSLFTIQELKDKSVKNFKMVATEH